MKKFSPPSRQGRKVFWSLERRFFDPVNEANGLPPRKSTSCGNPLRRECRLRNPGVPTGLPGPLRGRRRLPAGVPQRIHILPARRGGRCHWPAGVLLDARGRPGLAEGVRKPVEGRPVAAIGIPLAVGAWTPSETDIGGQIVVEALDSAPLWRTWRLVCSSREK